MSHRFYASLISAFSTSRCARPNEQSCHKTQDDHKWSLSMPCFCMPWSIPALKRRRGRLFPSPGRRCHERILRREQPRCSYVEFIPNPLLAARESAVPGDFLPRLFWTEPSSRPPHSSPRLFTRVLSRRSIHEPK